MDHVSLPCQGISKRLPDERVTRVGLYQLGEIWKQLLYHAVMLDQMLVCMQSAGKIAIRNIITRREQERVRAI